MKYVENILKNFINIENIEKINFKEIYGFYFAFKTTHIFIENEISSSSIKPIAIIYKENGEYYLAPLCDEAEKEEIVKNFVEKCLKK